MGKAIKALFGQFSHQILIMAALTGLGLRWFQIGTRSFWYDEAFSSLIARLSPAQIWDNVVIASIHPPGYYLLLHFWLLLGQSEATIRSLSMLFSLGAIFLIYGLGYWLFDKSLAALAALAIALTPFQVYFAQEARMYGLVVFIATALTWIFLYAVLSKGRWYTWLGYALIAVVGLYVHYFVGFLLLSLHFWVLMGLSRHKAIIGRLALADVLIVLLFLPQANQAFNNTGGYLVGGKAWQATPHVLSPLTTIYYLLFAHRSPIWIVPVGLFLIIAVLLLTLWESRRRSSSERYIELALWFSLVIPILSVLIISWLVQPIYLERSFAIVSPALLLLLAHGVIAAPKVSPTPYLALALVIPIVITLVVSVTTPDPAKPPVREATQIIEANFRVGDVSLHLQDASFMPATWYTPRITHLLAEEGIAWAPAEDHRLFGGDMVAWQPALVGADRLWLTVMPGFIGPAQIAVQKEIEATYPLLMVYDWGSVQLYLYDLREAR